MRSASVSYRRFIEGALAHRDARPAEGSAEQMQATGPDPAYIKNMSEAFDAAINDDLNLPKALGVAWQIIRHPVKSTVIFDLLLDMDEIFGLGLKAAATAMPDPDATGDVPEPEAASAPAAGIPDEIMALVRERDAARSEKDWKKSDELRDIIISKGYAVLDSKQGTKIERS